MDPTTLTQNDRDWLYYEDMWFKRQKAQHSKSLIERLFGDEAAHAIAELGEQDHNDQAQPDSAELREAVERLFRETPDSAAWAKRRH